MEPKKVLILIPTSFPYDFAREGTFLTKEVGYLAAAFDRVFIVPERTEGQRAILPQGVDVAEGFAQKRSLLQRFYYSSMAITSSLFWNELLQYPKLIFYPRALLRLLNASGHVIRTRRWMDALVRQFDVELDRIVFYTYWLGPATLGVGLLKEKYPQVTVVSRAHGGDVYAYRYSPPYIPFQRKILQYLDRLFLISEDGLQYISSQYPEFWDKYEVARLGVRGPGFVSSPSTDDVFRIVSCAYLTEVKRVELLANSLIRLAKMHPEQRLEWDHIGDGPLFRTIADIVSYAPRNLKARLLGFLPNEEVYRRYREKPVDLFVNASRSEGISVAIMEAVSCGIPVLATDVGGTKEIISDGNGFLIPKDITPMQLAEKLYTVIHNPVTLEKKRLRSHRVWRNKFDADANFQSFVFKIKLLLDQQVNE